MKLFRHYKNKPYKYLGLVKHSETLEDLVLYETRYENQNAKTWVRPKEMFFESVELNGQRVPRFAEIPLEIKATSNVSEIEISLIGQIMKKSFGDWDPKWFASTFNNHKNYFLLTGFVDGKIVGFKLGYELNDLEFYSWLGGVDPKFHRVGVASDLMLAQHEWCKRQGYKRIQTKTQNRFREMLLLNISFGFNVVGFHNSDEGGAKIVLEKELI